ncbi:MAG TPA: hypothetical protein DCW72_08325 [Elusimicrobia bacterium]|nr:MAG: hypothetical protein A2X29_05165 [Elusimicrobia bacterium GWA2_64_40]HAN04576.1 hypothetical protein [Elusimicrobiota bacterium]HAU90208.1 hypothetical protein [Elusimicrobiota bacterium]
MNALIVNLNLSVDKTALIPSFEPGRIFRIGSTITLPGGKGVNVARALRSLGLECPIAGFASGHNGQWITSSLGKEGFKTFIETHRAGESRVCYTVADAGGRTTDLNEEGPAVPASSQRAFLKNFSGLAPRFRAAAVCGRTSAGLKKGFYAALVRQAAAHGCFCVLDTSGPALAEAVAAGAAGVKINRYEFEELCGRRFSQTAVLEFFGSKAPLGLKTLIVTDGPDHAYAASPFGLWRVTPPRLRRLTSAVGAGDSFMAGFLFGFINGFDFERTLRLAAGAAASDCLSLGAGFIDRAQALDYASRAAVRKIK